MEGRDFNSGIVGQRPHVEVAGDRPRLFNRVGLKCFSVLNDTGIGPCGIFQNEAEAGLAEDFLDFPDFVAVGRGERDFHQARGAAR